MFSICCKLSKKGNPYLALCCGNWIVSVEEKVICYVAEKHGYTKRDVYSLEVDESIIL